MNINLEHISTDTLIGLVQDLNRLVSELEESHQRTRAVADSQSEARRRQTEEIYRLQEEARKWENKFLDLRDQETPYSESEIKSHLMDQLCEIAQDLDTHRALALLGAVGELGFKIKAIKGYREKTREGLKESKEAIENWRNVLGPPETNQE